MFLKDHIRFGSAKTRNVTSGLIAGTLVETAAGWQPVEDLRIGDAVHSYDGGLARVLGLDRQWITAQPGAYFLHLPGGALDNCSDLCLLPGQHLLIDTLNDERLPDDIVALIPAAALEGHLASRHRIDKPLEVILPRFADDEAIFANSGTLLHCPGIRQAAGQVASDFFIRLDLAGSQHLLQRTRGGHDAEPRHRQAA
jgi:hypothetical protein